MSGVKIECRMYKYKEVRTMYGMDNNPKAFKKMLDKYKDELGPRHGQFFDVIQMKKLFKLCGVPGVFLSDELEKGNFTKDDAA